MQRTILLYGLLIAALVILLSIFEYRHVVRDLSTAWYIGIVAFLFVAFGLWLGQRWQRPASNVSRSEATLPLSTASSPADWGLSDREYEVLQLMAQGLSNQEIADRLFLSVHTIKTHSSNLYSKLQVKRRTQAVRKAREQGLL